MSRFLLDTYPANSTIYAYFDTYKAADGASVTITGLAVTDIEIYKNGSTTQRSSDNGYALLDTDGIDIDGVTGFHGISIDLSDNSDASFYTTGAQFVVMLGPVTVDGQTRNIMLGSFRIVAAENTTGFPTVTLKSGTGTGEVSLSSGTVTTGAISAGAITAAAIATDAIDNDAIAANAVTEIQSGLATSSAQTTLQTDVTAIKAKTDSLTFTVASVLDANIQRVNDVVVDGTGAVGDEWRPS